MKMAKPPGGLAAIACIVFSAVTVIAMAITILSVNRRQLYNVTTWCDYYSFYYPSCYTVAHTCWASSDPLDDMTPCKYLYSLGAIGLLLQFWLFLLPCLGNIGALGCMALFGFFSFGWWLAGGIYFTMQFDDVASDQPAGHWRDTILGVTWTAFAMSTIQLCGMCAMAAAARKFAKHQPAADEEADGKPQVVMSPPPPQPVYAGEVPPGAYPPPPAPAGAYAAGIPPPPAGYPAPPVMAP